MKKLLITGASGFLGWYIARKAKVEWAIIGTHHSHSANISGITPVKIDLTKFNDLKTLFGEIKPAGVIHTAALTDPNYL